jgi:3-hexulose-6-phosphate synthase
MAKIQLALDTLDGDHALELAALAAPYVDIIEAGTPLIKSVGIGIVAKLQAAQKDPAASACAIANLVKEIWPA